jgi:hypothetical protein
MPSGTTSLPIPSPGLRGECGERLVPNVTLSLVNGMGGMLSAAGTLVLSKER